MTTPRRFAAALALIAGVALSQTAAGSASAVDVPYVIEFDSPASVSAEYGQYWTLPVTAENGGFWIEIYNQQPDAVITITGGPGSYKPDFYMYGATGSLSAPYNVPALLPGTYSFSISGTHTYSYGDTYHGATTSPGKLTVTTAQLGIELRVVADPANTAAAIVTSKFTGRFVDEYQSSVFAGAALSPAGVWNVTVRDADGEIATERSIERAEGDDVLSTSFYWADADPGEQYTASASFTPSGSSTSNFTISEAADFDYTAPEAQRPVPTSTATFEPDTSLPEATGFSLPLWLLITLGVLIAGLGVLVTILSVRLSRRSTSAAGEGMA